MKLILYYSGEACYANPEIILKEKANLMLTFAELQGNGKPRRWRAVRRARKLKKRVKY